MEDLNKLANQFITLWQENFAKAMADPKILESMMGATGNMQQFYDKFPNSYNQFNQSAAAANAGAHAAGADEPDRGDLCRKIDELERRVKKLEAAAGKAGGSGRKTGKK